jgi:hypothetical protein
MEVTSPPLIAEPTSAAVSLDRISQIRLSVVSRGSMHSAQRGAWVSSLGIWHRHSVFVGDLRYLKILLLQRHDDRRQRARTSWLCRTQAFEFTTGVLARGEVRLSQAELLLR